MQTTFIVADDYYGGYDEGKMIDTFFSVCKKNGWFRLERKPNLEYFSRVLIKKRVHAMNLGI
jgi:hypothetical protein